jgi:dTDP-4-dehydrorhamnose reductase
VGWELCRTLAPLGDVTAMDFPEIDLSNPDSLRQHLSQCRPNIIVNSAAYTAVDKSESEPDLAMKINGVAPGMLAEEARKSGALLVHYSTDYVFDGTKQSPYLESGKPARHLWPF